MSIDKKKTIASRVAAMIRSGQVVNLGIGIPTMVPNYIDRDKQIILHGENGVLGIGGYPKRGAEDADTFDASGVKISTVPGATFMDSAQSFALVRSGRIDVTVLGALEVDEQGDLANWIIPGKMVIGFGGAMDLITCCKTVIVAMEHTIKGRPKIKKTVSLPVTGRACVKHIVTEMGVMEVTSDGIILREVAAGLTVADVQTATDAELIVPTDLRVMPVIETA